MLASRNFSYFILAAENNANGQDFSYTVTDLTYMYILVPVLVVPVLCRDDSSLFWTPLPAAIIPAQCNQAHVYNIIIVILCDVAERSMFSPMISTVIAQFTCKHYIVQ